jgi:ABC-type nitrate/sulfonate/bicarbonate transport system substrate-binding protein
MIASGGLSPQDYEEIYVGATPDRYAALKSGTVAAAILLPPSVFSAIDDGFVPLGTLPAVMPVFPYTGYVGRADLATKKPEVLAAFMKGYLRGVRWLDDPANKARAVSMLSAATNSSADVSRRTYDEVVVKANCFPKDGKLVPKALQIVVDTLVQLNVIKPPIPALESLVDDRFVTAANVQLSRERA